MANYDGSVYPALVEQIDPARRSVSRPASDEAASVEDAVRDILGWRPKAGDAGGFSAALNASFTLRETEGHIEFDYVQRNYAVQMQADMGAVTGAQASLYTRAKNALDHALPLLAGLTPLRTDYDPQDTEATREIVQALFSDLVTELGAVGGPRCQRVENLFAQLLGSLLDEGSVDPATVGGQLGELRRRFGLERDRVGRLAEEQNLTNYWIVVEYVGDVRRSYLENRPYFERSGVKGFSAFFGTQLVLLSRQLALVADSVEETNFVLDSVFIDDAQRQTLWLSFADQSLGPRLSVYELLDWVSRVSVSEGPRLIQNAGRDGLGSLVSTLERLSGLLEAALDQAQLTQPGSLPQSFWSPRVQRALTELARQVEEARRLADEVARSPQDAGAPPPSDDPADGVVIVPTTPLAPAPTLKSVRGAAVQEQDVAGFVFEARGQGFSDGAALLLTVDLPGFMQALITPTPIEQGAERLMASLPPELSFLPSVTVKARIVNADGQESGAVTVRWSR